jgi:hypothetical protein
MSTKALALGLAAVLAVSCSDQPTSPTALNEGAPAPSLNRGPLLHHVSVGSPDVCEALGLLPGCDANLSLVANSFADGSVRGQWQDTFSGRGFPALGVHMAIDCLYVDGNEAWVSGVTTSPAFPGFPAIARVVDNGTSANDPPDQVSLLEFIDTPCTEAPDFQLFDLTKGQVRVW